MAGRRTTLEPRRWQARLTPPDPRRRRRARILTTQSLVDVVAAAQPVRTLVRAPTITVEQHDVRRDVARDLVAGAADAALVVGPIGEVGIVTARDIVSVVAAGGAVEGEQVRGVMSAELI